MIKRCALFAAVLTATHVWAMPVEVEIPAADIKVTASSEFNPQQSAEKWSWFPTHLLVNLVGTEKFI